MLVYRNRMLHGGIQQLFVSIGTNCYRAVHFAGEFPAINVFSRHINLRIQ